MKHSGLPVVPWGWIKGFTALREFLQNHSNYYVKVSKWRGSWETLFSEDYELVKPELDEREMKLSGVAEQIEFIVEEKLEDAVEMATDGWCIDGEFPAGTLVGVEVKDQCYAGKFMPWEEVPVSLQHLNQKLAPTLRNYGYRNFWSPESLISGGKAFLNDPCCRIPEPPGSLYLEFFTNLAEIIWAGANGQLIEPEVIAPIGVQLILCSEWSDCHWNTFEWPKKYDRNVKLREACFVDGKYRSIPQNIGLTQPASVVAWGKTLDEAEEMAIEVAQSIKATHLRVPLDAFAKLRETLEDAKIGIR